MSGLTPWQLSTALLFKADDALYQNIGQRDKVVHVIGKISFVSRVYWPIMLMASAPVNFKWRLGINNKKDVKVGGEHHLSARHYDNTVSTRCGFI